MLNLLFLIHSNYFDLGLIYTIEITKGGDAIILMSLTAPGCPVAEDMPGWVSDAVKPVNGIKSVNVEIVWEPQWGMDMMSDDIVIVRPSGNPLTKEGWGEMLNSSDIEAKGAKLIDIHVVKGSEIGDMCYACYTTHSKFSYKGVENDDVAVFVVIFRKVKNKWKMHYMQRSTGRKPSEPLPKFN